MCGNSKHAEYYPPKSVVFPVATTKGSFSNAATGFIFLSIEAVQVLKVALLLISVYCPMSFNMYFQNQEGVGSKEGGSLLY